MKNKIKSILSQLDNQSKTIDECLEMIMIEIQNPQPQHCANCKHIEKIKKEFTACGEGWCGLHVNFIEADLNEYYCENWEQKIF